MSKNLKVGIVGVGGISNTHLPGWEASEHAEIVAGCDIQEEILSDWGKKHGVKKLVTDHTELFSDPDIDIIDVCGKARDLRETSSSYTGRYSTHD